MPINTISKTAADIKAISDATAVQNLDDVVNQWLDSFTDAAERAAETGAEQTMFNLGNHNPTAKGAPAELKTILEGAGFWVFMGEGVTEPGFDQVWIIGWGGA